MSDERNYAAAVELIKRWEGCVLHAYQDSVGVWTIGYGTTAGVHHGMTITKAKALELMLSDMKIRANHLLSKITVPVTDNELCAMISLAYNIGLGAFDHSTLLRKLNAREPKLEVADCFMSWIKAGGHVLRGLVNRRHAERLLFLHSPHVMEEIELS